MDLVIVGIVLALAGIIAYYVRKSSTLENEKAALESSKAASELKVDLLEEQKLKDESKQREAERTVLEGFDDDVGTGDGEFFYPRLREDKNRLN